MRARVVFWSVVVVAVVAVLAQTPGRGWRWRTEDTGVMVAESAAFYSSSAAAEAAATEALGSDWPGSATEVFDTADDAEEAGWHYVGESGEPAFEGSWENVGGTWPSMAFRMRAGGIVDLVAVIENVGGSPTTPTVLPEIYRPLGSQSVPIPFTRERSGVLSARIGVIGTAGIVNVIDADTAGDIAYVSTSYFIGNADAP